MLPRLVGALVFLAVPAAGVLFFDWDWREVVLLYWLENITVGAVTVVRMLRSTGVVGNIRVRVNGVPVTGEARRPAMIGFFALHYGIFTLVHGVFVILLVVGVFPGLGEAADRPLAWLPIVLGWALATIVQVALARTGPRPDRSLGSLMGAPYLRIVPLHLTVLGAALIITATDAPALVALLLVGLHAVLDLIGLGVAAVRRRRSLNDSARQAPSDQGHN